MNLNSCQSFSHKWLIAIASLQCKFSRSKVRPEKQLRYLIKIVLTTILDHAFMIILLAFFVFVIIIFDILLGAIILKQSNVL